MIMAKVSDAEWMRRFVARAGSQRAAAEQLNITKSMVGRVARGERSGARYRDAARAGAQGRKITPPPPSRRTPKRVRQPVRQPRPDRGRMAQVGPRGTRGKLLGQEIGRARRNGWSIEPITISIRTTRAANYYGGEWSGAITIDPTEDNLDMIENGDLIGAIQSEHPWVNEDSWDVTGGARWDELEE